MLVHPDGRGHGLGGRLVDTCLSFVHDAGYQRMRLWTNHSLVAARRICLERGFTLIEQREFGTRCGELVGTMFHSGPAS